MSAVASSKRRAQGRIDNAPIREACLEWVERRGRFEAESDEGYGAWSVLCRRLAWDDSERQADTSRLRRALGLTADQQGVFRKSITADLAVKIGEAIGLDPVDLGL